MTLLVTKFASIAHVAPFTAPLLHVPPKHAFSFREGIACTMGNRGEKLSVLQGAYWAQLLNDRFA